MGIPTTLFCKRCRQQHTVHKTQGKYRYITDERVHLQYVRCKDGKTFLVGVNGSPEGTALTQVILGGTEDVQKDADGKEDMHHG